MVANRAGSLCHPAVLALVGWPRFLRGKIDWGLITLLAFAELILAVVGIFVLYYIVGWLLFG